MRSYWRKVRHKAQTIIEVNIITGGFIMKIVNLTGIPVIFKDGQGNMMVVKAEQDFKPGWPLIRNNIKSGQVISNGVDIPVYQSYITDIGWNDTGKVPDPKQDTIYVMHTMSNIYSGVVCDSLRNDVFVPSSFYGLSRDRKSYGYEYYTCSTYLSCINACSTRYQIVHDHRSDTILNADHIVNLCPHTVFNFVDNNDNLIMKVEPSEEFRVYRATDRYRRKRARVSINDVNFELNATNIKAVERDLHRFDIPNEKPGTIYLADTRIASDPLIFLAFKDRNDLFIPIKTEANKTIIKDGIYIIKKGIPGQEQICKVDGLIPAYRLEIKKKK